MNIPVFAFAAYSGTGKTTLIEKLLRELTGRGLRVAVIKHHSHDFEIDREGKDSWRFTQAGAKISMISSAEKTAAVCRESPDIRRLIASVKDVDMILVEGWKNEGLPRIGIARKATGKGFTAPADRFLATVSDFEPPENTGRHFGLEDIEAICDFLLEKAGAAVESAAPVAAGRVLLSARGFESVRGRVTEDMPQLLADADIVYGITLQLRAAEDDRSIVIEAAACAGMQTPALQAVAAAAVAVCHRYGQKDAVITDIRLL